MTKTCNRCSQELPLSSFGKLSISPDKLNYMCKPCNSKKGLDRYYAKREFILNRIHEERKANYEHRIGVERKSRLKNKEKWRFSRNARQSIRNKILGGNKYQILDKDLRRIYSSPCVNCGSRVNQSLDHVIPISRGGLHGVGNFITLCLQCNIEKRNRFFSEWKHSKKLNMKGCG